MDPFSNHAQDHCPLAGETSVHRALPERLVTRLFRISAVMIAGAVFSVSMPAWPQEATSPSQTSIPYLGEPYPSTYQRPSAAPVLIEAVDILDGLGGRFAQASLLLIDGKIAAINPSEAVPVGTWRIDGRGKWVTPGLIDAHSHSGVFVLPLGSESSSDVNEPSDPNAAQIWVEHAINPHDPNFLISRRAGITTLHVLPGSQPVFGGRSVVLKNVAAQTVQAMKFPGAPQGLKMACGANPKEHFGSKGRYPGSRMGVVAVMREAWAMARVYRNGWSAYQNGAKAEPPVRNLKLDTLAAALEGELLVHVHCYRSADMGQMIDLADEFGFEIAAFHHAVESYKIAPLLAIKGICSAVWADWWAFKAEAYDGVRANAALLDSAGACAVLHSDSRRVASHLTIEAAKAMSYGRRAGIPVTPEQAITWITSAPARLLGIDDQVGSIGPGKNADLVIWSGDPFSTYSRPEKVFIDGVLLFDRANPPLRALSDFELGQPALAPVQ